MSAFDDFNYTKVATYGQSELKQLLNNSSIIRNRSKICAVIHNAQILARLHRSGITLEKLTWRLVNRTPLDHLIIHSGTLLNYSDFIRPYLIQFRYYQFQRIGPKTLYSYLQAVGVVNDHLIKCFRHEQISKRIGEEL